MNRTKNKTLAIATSTKRIGVAVFSQKELLYFAVKTLKPPHTGESVERQVAQIMQILVDEFAPAAVVLKLLGSQQAKSKNQKLALKEIKHVAKTLRIQLWEVSFEQSKRTLCQGKKPTKTNLFKFISALYPELKQFVERPSKWQIEYYNALLSAAVIGSAYQSKFSE